MKNNLFFKGIFFVGLFAIGFVNGAMPMSNAEREARAKYLTNAERSTGIKPMTNAERSVRLRPAMPLTNAERLVMQNFSLIMNQDWNNAIQNLVNQTWLSFSLSQKRAVLQRMADQGLLSENEIKNWPMNIIPKKSYGG